MVDAHLPISIAEDPLRVGDLPLEARSRPLRWMFLDLNGFFAACEQQERPELRGRPIAVCPVEAETTFCIAASTEAKKYGVKCGVRVAEARRMCPDLVVVGATPKLYVAYNKAIKKAVETVLPVHAVRSIDEMSFRLLGDEMHPAKAIELAKRMKTALREEIGAYVTASIGIAPNSFLAKTATDMRKPDGLVVLQAHDLPHRLYELDLTDLCGINRRMKVRLNAAGIFTVQELCEASKRQIRTGFGSVIGEEWHYLLRGYDLAEKPTQRGSLGHSHVLSPARRTTEGARGVIFRLLQKATARLRDEGYWAGGFYASIKGDPGWERHERISHTQDTLELNNLLVEWFRGATFDRPTQASVGFWDLRRREDVTPSLFSDFGANDPFQTGHNGGQASAFGAALDEINSRFGKNKIFLGATHDSKDTADEKIAFQKTSLFSEGKGDHDFNPFRGPKMEPIAPDPIPSFHPDPNDPQWSDWGSELGSWVREESLGEEL